MINKVRRKIIAVIIFSMFISALVFATEEKQAENPNEKYPVRWTNQVKINSLGEIDSILDNFVDKYAETEHVLTFINDEGDKREVTTFKEYRDLNNEGYYPKSNWDVLYEFRFREACDSLVYIKNAKPSKTSYVGNFDLTKKPLKNLPPSLGLHLSGDEVRKVKAAIKKGTTWQEYDSKATVEIKNKNEILIKDPGAETYITLQSWGDFNGDDTEDVLLFVRHYAVGGTWRDCSHFILTRLTENGPLVDYEKEPRK